MKPKLLSEKYRTLEGARKRAALENGLAPGEFARGYKAKLYRYTVVTEGDFYRIQRTEAEAKVVQR
jgi:hypothetical protein